MARRSSYTLEEYSALKTAYGKPYSPKDLAITLLKPFLYIGIYTYLLYFYWWLSIIFGVVAALYQFRRVNILNARREYQASAFKERNRFINNLTQILTNPTRSTIDGLSEVRDRTKGEFKSDLTELLTRLRGASPSKVSEAFEKFASKYETDVIFLQYIDQLETAIIDGRTNIEMIKDIRELHNTVKEKRDFFLQRKEKRKKEFMNITNILLICVCAISFTNGIPTWKETFAHTPFGWIANTLFLFFIFLIFRGHLKRQEDDDVMEVSM